MEKREMLYKGKSYKMRQNYLFEFANKSADFVSLYIKIIESNIITRTNKAIYLKNGTYIHRTYFSKLKGLRARNKYKVVSGKSVPNSLRAKIEVLQNDKNILVNVIYKLRNEINDNIIKLENRLEASNYQKRDLIKTYTDSVIFSNETFSNLDYLHLPFLIYLKNNKFYFYFSRIKMSYKVIKNHLLTYNNDKNPMEIVGFGYYHIFNNHQIIFENHEDNNLRKDIFEDALRNLKLSYSREYIDVYFSKPVYKPVNVTEDKPIKEKYLKSPKQRNNDFIIQTHYELRDKVFFD